MICQAIFYIDSIYYYQNLFKMKKLSFFSLVALLLFVGITNAQNNVTIKGKIQNPVDTKVTFVLTKGEMTEPENITIDLDKTNSFVFSTKIDDLARFNFSHGTENGINWWILEPNDEVNMTFDAKNFYPSLKFEGKNAEKFNYYVADYIETDVKRKWGEQVQKNAELPIETQFTYLDTIMDLKLGVLEKYKSKVSPLFYEVWKADIKGMVNSYRFNAVYSERRKNKDFSFYALPAEQRKFVNDMPAQNDTTFKAFLYRNYLMNALYSMLYAEVGIISGNKEWSAEKMKGLRKAFFKDKFLELALAENVKSGIGYEGITPDSQKEYDEFLKDYPNSPYKAVLEKTYEKMKVYAVGKPAIPFTLKNEKGIEVNLQDFKNKVVYLDFWASWCGPCIQEMKASKPVKEHFKDNKNLVFLYISIDEKAEDWKTAMEKYEVKGVNLWADKAWQDPVALAYNIQAIPKYYLIDGEGKFNDANPPRASRNAGKDLIKALETALEKLKK